MVETAVLEQQQLAEIPVRYRGALTYGLGGAYLQQEQ